MLTRDEILQLIPHQGDMCLLDAVVDWSDTTILCRAQSHRSLSNPLRRAGQLSALCGIEYGLQAAALHGALLAGSSQPAGYLAALRAVSVHTPRLDDNAFDVLQISAELQLRGISGLIYQFCLTCDGRLLLEGRAGIVIPTRASNTP